MKDKKKTQNDNSRRPPRGCITFPLPIRYPDKTLWEREMEIEPAARGGKKVFPEIDRDIHLVPSFLPLNRHDWTVYMCCDPHPRRAHGFVWLAVNRYGEMTIPWSWWPEDRNEARERGEEGHDKRYRLLISEYAEHLNSQRAASSGAPTKIGRSSALSTARPSIRSRRRS